MVRKLLFIPPGWSPHVPCKTHKQVLHLETPFLFHCTLLTAMTSGPLKFKLLYHINMWIRTCVEFEISAAVVESTQCFGSWFDFASLLSDKSFDCFCVFVFKSILLGALIGVPQLNSCRWMWTPKECNRESCFRVFFFCLIHAVSIFLHFILEQCPLQVTTVKMCIIMKYLLRHRFLVQRLTNCNSVGGWRRKKKHTFEMYNNKKNLLIEFVEVPLEFNIIF